MTPTLVGRWQTRLALLVALGIPLTLPFARRAGDWRTPFAILVYVLVLGVIWDWVYQRLQRRRWDGDWPPLLQALGGVAEGALLWSMLTATPMWIALGVAGPPGVRPGLAWPAFVAHYGTVWLAMFIATQGPLRVLFPRWRFDGGRIWSARGKEGRS